MRDMDALQSLRTKYLAISLLAVTLVLAAIAFWWWQNLPDERAADPTLVPGAVVAIGAQDLAAAYDEDAIAADLKFGDNTVKVTGTLTEVSAGAQADPILILGGSNPALTVTAALDTQDVNRIAAIPVGSSVTVTCKSVSFIGETPALDDCSLG